MIDFFTYEDRPSHEASVKLLALSLERHQPDATLHFVPAGGQSDLSSWLSARRNCRVCLDMSPGLSGWNVKPNILLGALDRGFSRPIWIDSDIIVRRSLDHLFERDDLREILVTQERSTHPKSGGIADAMALGLQPRKEDFPHSLCSCIVAVSEYHRSLLTDWHAILGSREYREAQSLPGPQRPGYYFSDQDILAGLLGSEKFASIPIHWIMADTDIVQYHEIVTYGVLARLRHLFGDGPAFIHAQGRKPWQEGEVRRMTQQVSPYRLEARRYLPDLTAEEGEWLNGDSMGALFSIRASGGHYALSGLPVLLGRRLKDRLVRR